MYRIQNVRCRSVKSKSTTTTTTATRRRKWTTSIVDDRRPKSWTHIGDHAGRGDVDDNNNNDDDEDVDEDDGDSIDDGRHLISPEAEFFIDAKHRSLPRKPRPCVGVLDRHLIPSQDSFERNKGSWNRATGQHYRFRFGGQVVYHPEMVKHEQFENSEEAFNNYPTIITALMVISSLACAGFIVAAVLTQRLAGFVWGDFTQLEKECKSCLNYMKYKPIGKQTVKFKEQDQLVVLLAAVVMVIASGTTLRFFLRSILQHSDKKAVSAFTIMWYLAAAFGEIAILNIIVDWNAPVQKVLVNVIWVCFDGRYIGYLTVKLAEGKLEMKKIIPIYYFTSITFCLLYGFCFVFCLSAKRLNYVK